MTPAQFKARCTAIGLQYNTEVAAALGLKTRHTIRRWLSGETPVPHWVEAQLSAIESASLKRREASK